MQRKSTLIPLLCLLMLPLTSTAWNRPDRRSVQVARQTVYDTVRVIVRDTVRVIETVPRTPRADTLTLTHTPSEIDSLVDEWQRLFTEAGKDLAFGHMTEVLEGETHMAKDSLYKTRLQDLISPVSLPYNYIVRDYIDSYLSSKWSPLGRILALSRRYFPMIEEELLKADIPIELRALPIIESNLSPTAASRAGAVGLWQFMPSTAKLLGLEVNSLVDERMDPVLSTRAACRFLNSLYKTYGDWTLVLAAYNCGPGNVSRALARAGNAKSYWDIYDYLPRETRGYVPKFIAAVYAYTYYHLHGIREQAMPQIISVDTVSVDRIMHLGQVASTLSIPIETLEALNPQYKIDIIPASRKTYPLTLPTRYTSEFVELRDSVFAKDSLYLKEYLNPDNLEKKRAEGVGYVYKVRKGDNLGLIAKRNHTTVKELMKWNHLKSTTIREGQKLRIEKPKPKR